jgi:hypothetical protein
MDLTGNAAYQIFFWTHRKSEIRAADRLRKGRVSPGRHALALGH